MPIADPGRESLSPRGHINNRFENTMHLRAGGLEPLRCIHDKIRTPALFGVVHLIGK